MVNVKVCILLQLIERSLIVTAIRSRGSSQSSNGKSDSFRNGDPRNSYRDLRSDWQRPTKDMLESHDRILFLIAKLTVIYQGGIGRKTSAGCLITFIIHGRGAVFKYPSRMAPNTREYFTVELLRASLVLFSMIRTRSMIPSLYHHHHRVSKQLRHPHPF